MYIFGGYNNVIGYHFNDLYEFNPLTSTWRRIRTHGIANPIPRRRQCCLVIEHRMYMFGGTSPVAGSIFPDHINHVLDTAEGTTNLHDQNDLYIFDFAPTLRTLCFLRLVEEQIDEEILPTRLRAEYRVFSQSNSIRPRFVGTSRRA